MTVHEKIPPMITAAIISQQNLGAEFTLRGYLTNEWFYAMKHFSPDKPDQKLSHLYIGLWKHIFEAAWGKRNELAHSEESITSRFEREQLISELYEWKRLGGSRIGHSQLYLLDYDHTDIRTWPLPTLRTTASMLKQAAENFIHTEQESTSQTLITGYFTPIIYDNLVDDDYG